MVLEVGNGALQQGWNQMSHLNSRNDVNQQLFRIIFFAVTGDSNSTYSRLGSVSHLAGDDGLDEETQVGEHGKTAVLDLLHAQLGEGVGVVSQTQGVE